MTKKTNNAVATFKTGLIKTQETFINMIQSAGNEMNLSYDNYQLSCARNMMTSMVDLLYKSNLNINDINQNNITEILQTVAMLKLNTASTPREVYVIMRNVKVGDSWTKEFEMGVEGDGNDKILREYGVNIKKVHNYWVVRENDVFTYPTFSGLEIKPPTWQPKDYHSKIVRVVYPIEMTDGAVEFHISEREEVANNLKAHISNNLMKNKAYSDSQKQDVLDRISNLSLEDIYKDADALKIMSPAWRGSHSQEAMFLRKMRNNAIKKIPKDFSSSFIEDAHRKTFEDYEQYQVIDVDPIEKLEVEYDEEANSEPVVHETINVKNVEEVADELPNKDEKLKSKDAPF